MQCHVDKLTPCKANQGLLSNSGQKPLQHWEVVFTLHLTGVEGHGFCGAHRQHCVLTRPAGKLQQAEAYSSLVAV